MGRASQAEWAKRVKRWRASGLTAHAFARRHRISESSLKWWKWRLQELANQVAIVPHRHAATDGRAPSTPVTFVEMTPAGPTEPFEIILASGIRIRVAAHFDGAALEHLLQIVERRP